MYMYFWPYNYSSLAISFDQRTFDLFPSFYSMATLWKLSQNIMRCYIGGMVRDRTRKRELLERGWPAAIRDLRGEWVPVSARVVVVGVGRAQAFMHHHAHHRQSHSIIHVWKSSTVYIYIYVILYMDAWQQERPQQDLEYKVRSINPESHRSSLLEEETWGRQCVFDVGFFAAFPHKL